MADVDQAAILEAMRRANPDVPGDLMRHLRALSPRSAEIVERLERLTRRSLPTKEGE